MAKKPLVIIGAGETAEMACEYFTWDSPYEVVAFSVERAFWKADRLFDRPIVPFEDLEKSHPPGGCQAFVALSFVKLNRPRMRLYEAVKAKGYTAASYVSSRAFVWRDVVLGENCFIMENNVLQYQVRVGNNVTMWSGNHVGHRAVVDDHCFISSHCVISGFCHIGSASFLGVNSTLGDRVKIGRDNLVGAGALITRDTPDGTVVPGAASTPSDVSSYRFCRVTP